MGDRILLVIPLCLHGIELVAHLGQFLLNLLQMLHGDRIGLFLQSGFFDLMLNDLSRDDLIQLGRHGIHLGTDHRASFIDQINRLIGKKTVGDITVGEGSGSYQCLIGES